MVVLVLGYALLITTTLEDRSENTWHSSNEPALRQDYRKPLKQYCNTFELCLIICIEVSILFLFKFILKALLDLEK